MTTHVQVTNLDAHHCSRSSLIVSHYLCYLLWIYLAITLDHHSHQSLCIRPPFLLCTFLFISLSLWKSLPHTLSHFPILFLFSTIFSYTASLFVTPSYAHSSPSIFQLSVSFYWLYHYIFVLHLLIYLFILHLIAHHCLTTLPIVLSVSHSTG